jgi:hypothetical protein
MQTTNLLYPITTHENSQSLKKFNLGYLEKSIQILFISQMNLNEDCIGEHSIVHTHLQFTISMVCPAKVYYLIP